MTVVSAPGLNVRDRDCQKTRGCPPTPFRELHPGSHLGGHVGPHLIGEPRPVAALRVPAVPAGPEAVARRSGRIDRGIRACADPEERAPPEYVPRRRGAARGGG